ncbi:MAG: biopolymer transporter ExbD [Candidatus Omnitrophica bacterium]|nr:biopolymer transporter ExbD [Candidatus Omnitrophota bacterium]
MKLKRQAQVMRVNDVFQWVSFFNVLLQVVFFYFITSAFTLSPQIDVQIPKAVTSDALVEEDSVILITSENLIYWRNAVISLKDLKQQLHQAAFDRLSILIKADRRASLGRIVDIWNLCKSLEIERVNIVTTSE